MRSTSIDPSPLFATMFDDIGTDTISFAVRERCQEMPNVRSVFGTRASTVT